jgi:hypothetical protein
MRDFPNVELGELKWMQPTANDIPMANFTVVCMPGAEGQAAKTPSPTAKSGKAKTKVPAKTEKAEAKEQAAKKKTATPTKSDRKSTPRPVPTTSAGPRTKEGSSHGT